jgi:hypothetical protein
MFSLQVVTILDIILKDHGGRCDFRIPVAQQDTRMGPKCDNPVLGNFGHLLMGTMVTGLSRVDCSQTIFSLVYRLCGRVWQFVISNQKVCFDSTGLNNLACPTA